MDVTVTGIAVHTALGTDLSDLRARLAAGERAIRPLGVAGLDVAGARAPDPDLSAVLRRRKDARLLSRPAAMALRVAQLALGDWAGDREALGIFVGVRREPPDIGEADPAIAASLRDGAIDPRLLAGPGRDRYPPLLPLSTLPNMVLAHVAIQLGIRGPADTCAGGAVAGLQALRLAAFAVAEGRCPAALAIAADSWVDGTSVRDHLRLERTTPPGEAAVALRIEPSGGLPISDLPGGPDLPLAHLAALGECGAADGLLALVLGGAAGVDGVRVRLGDLAQDPAT